MTRRTKSGHLIKPFAISAEHWAALQRAAFKRAAEAGFLRPNASAILREILDAWMKRGGGGR